MKGEKEKKPRDPEDSPEVDSLVQQQTEKKKKKKEKKGKSSSDEIKSSRKSQRSTFSGSSSGKQQQKAPSRFSLRRLFYRNPLLAQPFFQSPLSGRSSASSSRKRNPFTSTGAVDSREDSRSWRDTSSLSSQLQGASALLSTKDGKTVKECPLCLQEVPLDQFPVLRNCPHLSCLECLQQYVKIEIQEGKTNLQCPKCTQTMHPNDVEVLLGENNSHLLTLYESLMLRRVLANDPDTRWCPGPNCTYAVIAAGCASCPQLNCERPGCGFSFCYHCKAEWHPNQTCDSARSQRQPRAMNSFSQDSGMNSNTEVKLCPRCSALIAKMDDGSCNHMTCAVCGAEFCWLCMKEISDLHYLSPSGCTFWGKKPWSRKKKLLWQLGTLVGAPVGIALLATISVPAMIIGIPIWVGRKLKDRYKTAGKNKQTTAVLLGVSASLVISPMLAGLAVSIGVPILLAYVYGVVPISLCKSDGCGVSTRDGKVRIDVDEDASYKANPMDTVTIVRVANPSIGEASLGASLSLGSNLEDREERDRESASNTAIAGTSLTGSVASSYIGGHHRLEVGADVHPRKKFSFSSERLSETVSLSERSGTVSLADDGAASTRALAGSIIGYRMDSQSMNSYRAVGACDMGDMPASGDEISLRSCPGSGFVPGVPPRSLSPVSQVSVGEDGRRSTRRRAALDKQLSENSSLMSEDTTSERVRFDDNVSVIDSNVPDEEQSHATPHGTTPHHATPHGTNQHHAAPQRTLIKPIKIETCVLHEETPEELALVISPEPKRTSTFPMSGDHVTDRVTDTIVTLENNVTNVSITDKTSFTEEFSERL